MPTDVLGRYYLWSVGWDRDAERWDVFRLEFQGSCAAELTGRYGKRVMASEDERTFETKGEALRCLVKVLEGQSALIAIQIEEARAELGEEGECPAASTTDSSY